MDRGLKLSYNTVNLILLRKESHFTQLIVLRAHENIFHSGLESTPANVHLHCWIIKGRQFVKKVCKKCYVCKLTQVKFLLPSKTPSLPSLLVSCCYPFETTGIDYARPFFVKEGNDNELRKCHLLLFICETFLAVHLEITRNFFSKSLVLAIRRLVARVKPALLVSNIFKSFKSADVKKFIL